MSEQIMPFGRYEGCTLDEVPTWYLSFCLEKLGSLGEDLRAAIQAELDERTPSARYPR